MCDENVAPRAAATLAVLICVMGGSVVLSIAADERADSLAGLVSALATPGSNRNPLPLGYQMRAPHVSKASLFPEMLELANVDGPDVVLALATVVTQDGRVVRGQVIDYLDFHLWGWHWPAFNVADIAIVSGTVALALGSLRGVAGSAALPRRQRR